uniref:Uncharacterized protein n=1 Tax=Anaplasma phagocytophilum TaxID=948 RepID=W6DI75_ANAPH|nr:hypothetical protein [Anaplasma phagocytophilum]
MTSGRFKVF